jgi:hypothetical protein
MVALEMIQDLIVGNDQSRGADLTHGHKVSIMAGEQSPGKSRILIP